ncbi:hypothetical protein PIIN_10556 [Serendipita indica DSM 11827]|uniref:DUF676 domain-containing protein n=1 Tax=Serendipita indica (strain DSM 11827) TaxID=1109443 RepID=G4TZ20_SERID|nr:hypothetical protein PIIN_10556 [Serendipita indica DSM 11827]
MSDVPFYKRLYHLFKSDKPQTEQTPRTEQAKQKPKSKVVDYGLLNLAEGDNPIVDIIAIHGLDGHRLDAWTETESKAMWLREFLPEDIPRARILTYGYDADTRSSEFTSTNTIQRHAMGFMQAVERARKGVERRPIIFLAHSLGGIILKQALVLCQIQPEGRPLRGILTSTHAVLFFGTPHSGSEGVPFLQVLNQLLSVYMQTNNRVLQHLRENSEALENIQATFTQASAGLHIVYFYEEYATPLIGGQTSSSEYFQLALFLWVD